MEVPGGISIKDRHINSVKFVDDMVILANDCKEHWIITVKIEETIKKYGIKINMGKLEIMRLSKNDKMTVMAKKEKRTLI